MWSILASIVFGACAAAWLLRKLLTLDEAAHYADHIKPEWRNYHSRESDKAPVRDTVAAD